ncbi:MAG: TonB-dependent receptor [Bacteroidales bacterium]|nr:TonB-dependent receptor [Bacteroidales bacterium]
MLKRLLLLISLLSIFISSAMSQVTTASMSGKVISNNEAVIGATVVAVHEPSGTRYGTITNVDGRYAIEGMRTGGPYKVTFSYVGFESVNRTGINLQLGDNYVLNVDMKESSEVLADVIVTGTKSKFNTMKTGASTNISNEQLKLLPSINRSITDFTRLSPYAGANNSIGGRDGRTNSFTIDGANLNNNFGLSNNLPGGGNPISLDAIEEVQVVVAPYDVRQTNFVGGGINAITKSGTNKFTGSAYTYQRNEDFRGNSVDGVDLGTRAPESTETYGATLGGPIIKDKLFFFVNGEYENSPNPITKWKVSKDGVANTKTYTSRVTGTDMQNFADILQNTYNYNPGSYTNYDGGTKNYKFLGRIDWNITDAHKLSMRYNYTKNSNDLPTNVNSTVGSKATSGRISSDAMSFRNACYAMDNLVSSFTAELNSRFASNISNRALFTFSKLTDQRSTGSSPFPFIDIWKEGQAFMSAGYELFSWNNKVENTIINFQDNATMIVDNHKFTAGLSFEYQKAVNNFMRFGTGYYKYASFDDFKNQAAPIAFGLTYGYGGEANPASEVAFGQYAIYGQDEWSIGNNFKLTYGIRLDYMQFLNDLERNEAFYNLDWKDHFVAKDNADYSNYNAPKIDTGLWPSSKVLVSPRIGFNWDVYGDKSLKIRGGSGVFTGRIPLVFFTNMPTNAGMIQNTYQTSDAKVLANLSGKMLTNVNDMISALGLDSSKSPYTNGSYKVSGATVVGVSEDFKLPQVWKNSLGVDYQLPVYFPLTVSAELMFNKDINAVTQDNYNITNVGNLSRFPGPDNRINYGTSSSCLVQSGVSNGAMVLTNTHKGYSGSYNIMVNAEPVKNLNLMASYTNMYAKEISGLPGSQAYSAWQNCYSVDGPNQNGLSYSQYLTPNKVIASASYRIEYGKNKNFGTNFGLYYAGYNAGTFSYYFDSFSVYNAQKDKTDTYDMNGDGINTDLVYIPKSKDELTFVDYVNPNNTSEVWFTAAEQADAFWEFINQDDYLKNRKGKYAEAYGAKLPWVNRIDLKISQDFKLKVGNSVNTLQVSLDVLNVGNLINDSWGVTNTTAPSNYGKILSKTLTYTSNGVPTYNMSYITGSDKKKHLINHSFDKNYTSSNCWQLQLGVRYIFN